MESGCVPKVNPDRLADVVRLQIGRPLAQLGEWHIEELHGGVQYESAVYRLGGNARDGAETQKWALVLKIECSSSRNAAPESYAYWKREAQVYRSGLPYSLPAGLTAPRCFGVDEEGDETVWIWLEEVKSDFGSSWSMEQYGEVARRLGRVTGAFLTGAPQPDAPWLPRDWLKRYLDNAAPMAEFIQNNPDHPLVRSSLPGISLALTLAAWQERGAFLGALERLPQTFCHQDAFIRNLFVRGDELVGIDWCFAGIAPLGTELASLIGPTNLTNVPGEMLRRQDKVCFDGYLQGLRDSGWQGNPRLLRLGFTVSVLLRYVLGATVGEAFSMLLDADKRDFLLENIGKTEEQMEHTDPHVAAYFQGVMVEALRILGIGFILRYLFRTLQWVIRLAWRKQARKDVGMTL